MATDLGGISGTIFDDVTGDGQSSDDNPVAGAIVELFLDDGDNVFDDSIDIFQNSTSTGVDGSYSFNRLSAGTYFVRRELPISFIARPGSDVATVTISTADAMGTVSEVVDDFRSGDQSINGATPNSDSVASSAIGGERDLNIFVNPPLGGITMSVQSALQTLFINNSSDSAIHSIVYDGSDNDSVVDQVGLGGIDITNASSADQFFQIAYGANTGGTNLQINIHTDADDGSQAFATLPSTGGELTGEVLIPLSTFDLIDSDRGGADFTNVGAIEVIIIGDDPTNLDLEIDLIQTVAQTNTTVDFAVFQPLTLGDLVFNDVDNNGSFDPITDIGLSQVNVSIYEDTNASGTLESADDQAVSSTSTDGAGGYSFANLFPGDYIVVVDQTNFDALGSLQRFMLSSGGGDPDDDNNNDSNGVYLSGMGVIAPAITLAANSEPTTDGDANDNTNLTVDFGFADASISVSAIDNPDPVTAGEDLTLSLNVNNLGLGTLEDTTATITLPPEFTYTSGIVSQGTMTPLGQTVSVDLGGLAPGLGSATIDVTVSVDSAATGLVSTLYSVDSQSIQFSNSETTEILPQPNPASALDDTISTEEDTQATFDPTLNDLGDILTIVSFDASGALGNITAAGGNELIYTPLADEFGDDSFTYTISDGTTTSVGTVSVTIAPVNDDPIFVADPNFTTPEETIFINGNATLNDSAGPANENQTVSISSVTSPTIAGGIATLSNGLISYTPQQGYVGVDTIQYVITDGAGGFASATATVDVLDPSSFSLLAGTPYSTDASLVGFVTDSDIDNDGDVDLIVANEYESAYQRTSSLSIFANDGSGAFSQIKIPLAQGVERPQGIFTGDLNGDQRHDLAVAFAGGARDEGQVFVSLDASVYVEQAILSGSDTASVTWNRVGTGAGPSAIAGADVDLDGDLDLGFTNFYGDSLTILLNNGSGGFSTGQTIATGNRPADLVFGDLEGNGIYDVAVANHGSNSVQVFTGSSFGGFTLAGSRTGIADPTGLTVGNFDGNNFDDLAVSSATGVQVFYNDGDFTEIDTTPLTIPVSGVLRDIDSVDANDDDYDDLLVASASSESVVYLENDFGSFLQSGDFTLPHVVPGVPAIPKSLAINDFDGDGVFDVAAAMYGNGISVQNGVSADAPVVTATVTGTVFEDVNGNGTQDLGEFPLSGAVVFADLGNDGQLNFGEPEATTDASGFYSLTLPNPGTYIIQQIPIPGLSITTPVNGAYDVTVAANQTASDINFANEDLFLPGAFGEFTNTANRYDVNDDGDVSLVDALVILNGMNSQGSGEASALRKPTFADVNGDGLVTSIDALRVINEFARQKQAAFSELFAAIEDDDEDVIDTFTEDVASSLFG